MSARYLPPVAASLQALPVVTGIQLGTLIPLALPCPAPVPTGWFAARRSYSRAWPTFVDRTDRPYHEPWSNSRWVSPPTSPLPSGPSIALCGALLHHPQIPSSSLNTGSGRILRLRRCETRRPRFHRRNETQTDSLLPSPVPSQTLPDHLQDPHKFSPRSVSRLDEEDEDEANWTQTIRPPAIDTASTRLPAHSRDSSLDKLPHPPPILTSPRIHPPRSRSAVGGATERIVDTSKNSTYGHHRQTSIVHGIQHSRNGSLASSTSSPLSPQMIAAAGAAYERPDMHSVAARLEADPGYPSRPTTALAGPIQGSAGLPMERTHSAVDLSSHGATQRKLERMHSRSRRDHPAHHSNSSRSHRDDQKTVGEYALHVLFTSVSWFGRVESEMSTLDSG